MNIGQGLGGLLNAVLNLGGTPGMSANIKASRPAATGSGNVFISTDTGEVYYDLAAGNWVLIGSATPYSFDNGLTNTAGVVSFGGNLIADTTINNAGFVLTMSQLAVTDAPVNPTDVVRLEDVPAPVTVSNGLTRTGNNIALGGALTADTAITGSSLFTFNKLEVQTNPVNPTDVARLADLPPALTAGNAIRFNGDAIDLGGDFFKAATLNVNGNGFFVKDQATGVNFLVQPDLIDAAVADTSGNNQNSVYIDNNFVRMSADTQNNTGRVEIELSLTGAIVDDTQNNKGLANAGDYESNFTGRSLTTKNYVDSNIIKGGARFPGLGASQNLLTYPVTGSGTDYTFRASFTGCFVSGVGSSEVIVTYTDERSIARTSSFGISTIPSTYSSLLILNAKTGTSISVDLVITGTAVSDCYVYLELLG